MFVSRCNFNICEPIFTSKTSFGFLIEWGKFINYLVLATLLNQKKIAKTVFFVLHRLFPWKIIHFPDLKLSRPVLLPLCFQQFWTLAFWTASNWKYYIMNKYPFGNVVLLKGFKIYDLMGHRYLKFIKL